jgi:hypothetical protein
MDPDPGGPKTYASYGSGCATLLASVVNCDAVASLCDGAGEGADRVHHLHPGLLLLLLLLAHTTSGRVLRVLQVLEQGRPAAQLVLEVNFNKPTCMVLKDEDCTLRHVYVNVKTEHAQNGEKTDFAAIKDFAVSDFCLLLGSILQRTKLFDG